MSRRRTPHPLIAGSALPLSPAALTALYAGNRDEAIRIVQQAEGVGLDEATDAVDAVLESNPMLKRACEAGTDGRGRGMGAVLGFVLVLGALVITFLFIRR